MKKTNKDIDQVDVVGTLQKSIFYGQLGTISRSICLPIGLRSRIRVPAGTPISWQASFGIRACKILFCGSPCRKAVATSKMKRNQDLQVAMAKRICREDRLKAGDEVSSSPRRRFESENPCEEPNAPSHAGCRCCRQTISAQTVPSSLGSSRPSQGEAQSPTPDFQKLRPILLSCPR